MSTYGSFEIEDSDIVRLDGRIDGENDGRERAGWVNVGAFAVRIEMSSGGDLIVSAYPCGAEMEPLARLTASHADAMAAGATDNAADSEARYTIHEGTDPDAAALFGRFWWAARGEPISGLERSEGLFDSADDAKEDFEGYL